MSSTTALIVQEYISSLAGRYNKLNDVETISGESLRRFNTYIYSRKLLIRKSIPDDPAHHLIYCTHCTHAPWRVPATFTTTSAQLRHLRQYHSRLPTSQEEENLKIRDLNSAVSTGSTISGSTPFTLAAIQGPSRSGFSQFDNKTFRELLLAVFIVSSNSSLSIVENPNFYRMLQYCNPKARMISRRTISNDIYSLYRSLFQQVIKRLSQHCEDGGKISITLDAWSSPTRIPFLGITGHYIEGHTWQFQSILLGFERLHGSHTADSLNRVLLSVLQ